MKIDIYSFPELELLLITKDIKVIPIFVIKEEDKNNVLIFLYYIVLVKNDRLNVLKIYYEDIYNQIQSNVFTKEKIEKEIEKLLNETNIENEKFYYSINSYSIDNMELIFVMFKPLHFLNVLKEIYDVNGIIFNIIRNREEMAIFNKIIYIDDTTNTTFTSIESKISVEKSKSLKLQIKKLVKDKRYPEPFLRTYHINIQKFKKDKLNKNILIQRIEKQKNLLLNATDSFIKTWLDTILENNFKFIDATDIKDIEKSSEKVKEINNLDKINKSYNAVGKNVYENLIKTSISNKILVNQKGNSVIKSKINIQFNSNNKLNKDVINNIKNNIYKDIDISKISSLIEEIIEEKNKQISIGLDYELSKEKEPIHLINFFKLNISKMIDGEEIPHINLILSLLKEIKNSENIGYLLLSSSKTQTNKDVQRFLDFLKVSKYNLYKKLVNFTQSVKYQKGYIEEIFSKIRELVKALEKDNFITKEEKKFLLVVIKKINRYYRYLSLNIHPIKFILDNVSPISLYFSERLLGIWFSTLQTGFIYISNNSTITHDDKDYFKKLLMNTDDIEYLYNRIIENKKVINGILSYRKL